MESSAKISALLLCFMLSVLLLVYTVGRQSVAHFQGVPEEYHPTEWVRSSELGETIVLNNKSLPDLHFSTCSDQATKRGPHQRVISFSLYGNLNSPRRYLQGIEANSVLVPKLYPGWVVRVYHDIPTSNKNTTKIMSDLLRRFKYLDICNCNNIPGYGSLIGTQANMWRFLPMADPLVDVFVSRDLDSLIADREVAAVKEWLDSGLTFHVMRDNPAHGANVLAGMWGLQVHQARMLLLEVTAQMLVRGRIAKDKPFDQTLLAQVLWPVMKDQVMQHDSYWCKKYRGYGHMRPWPTRRNSSSGFNFVGARITVPDDAKTLRDCPVECRPAEHHEWTKC